MNKYIYDVKNIFSILPKNLKKKFNLIFFLLSIGGLLETLGIGILIPLINIIISDNTKIPILGNIINFDDFSKIQLIIILGVIIFSLYFVKAIYLSFLEFFIQKFSLRVNSEVTTQLFKTYLNNPYKFIFTNNSSVLFRNLTSEVSNFCAGIIEPLIMAAKEFFIISLIISMLIAINYKISLIIIIFSIIFFSPSPSGFVLVESCLASSEYKALACPDELYNLLSGERSAVATQSPCCNAVSLVNNKKKLFPVPQSPMTIRNAVEPELTSSISSISACISRALPT